MTPRKRARAKLEKINPARLYSMIMALLNYLLIADPKLYWKIERRMRLGTRKTRKTKTTRVSIKTRSTRTRHKVKSRGKRRAPKNWRINLAKAVRANPRMSPEAKRKALSKLGAR